MKNKNIFKCLLGAAIMVMSGAFVSCNDQPDKFEMTGGEPVVKYVRLTDPEKADSLLDKAMMETTVCLVGDNLRSIHKLWFNDQPAILNISLITDHTLIVTIPSKIPGEITDKIYMETRDGKMCDYDFQVLVPSPVITSMKNEWVPAGEEAVIFGRYFVEDENNPIQITLPGGLELSHDNITFFSETEIHFTVPEEAANVSGQISVTSLYGTGRSPFYFHDNRGIIFDFDGVSPLNFTDNCWHGKAAKSDENSLSGNYIQFGDGSKVMDDVTWDDGNFFAEYWCGTWDQIYPDYGQGMQLKDLVDMTNWENMSLKFEMQVPADNAWNAAAMQIVISPASLCHIWEASWDFFNGDATKQAPRAMYRPWQTVATGEFHTSGQWITVSIPLSSFIYDMDGGVCANQITGPDSFGSFQMSVVGGGINTDKECYPIIRVDNIRLVENL